MKKSLTLLLLVLTVATSIATQEIAPKDVLLSAQDAARIDVSGKWVGKRIQYAWDKRSPLETFEYEFNLTQTGNVITGTTSIINAEGHYADMAVEGILIGNTLHFAEKEVKGANRPEGKVWCFKRGELKFTTDGNTLKLSGSTPSFMEIYNYPCSGGFTELSKADNTAHQEILKAAVKKPATEEIGLQVSAFPNPFTEYVNLQYTLPADATVRLEVFDLNGRQIATLANGKQLAGPQRFTFNARSYGLMSGVYVIKLVVNGEAYSRQIVQTL